MSSVKLGLTAVAVACLLGVAAPEPAEAQVARPLALRDAAPSIVLHVDRVLPRFHGRRVQSAYCLKRNYWWFYRPYTTAPQDYARCMPYFHYLDGGDGRRGGRSGGGYYK